MLPYQGWPQPFQVPLLDAQTQWVNSISSTGTFTMENGGVYLLQPQAGSGYIGFGADASAAAVDAGAGKGLFLDTYQALRVIASDPTKLVLGWTGSVELRVRRLDVMVWTTPQG
jgi:hypothetical protein